MDQARLFSVQLLCAGGSGAIAKTSVAPLERVKILLQVQSGSSVPKDQQYKGLLDALKRIPQREGGWRALYRGNGANVIRLVPEVALRYAVHDQFKLVFGPASGTPTGLAERLAPGAATGVVRSLLFYPLDLCRTRITADTAAVGQPRVHSSIRQVLAKTVAKEGVRGLYRGMLPSMISIVPNLAISLATYDYLKQALPVDKVSRAQAWYPVAKMGAGSAAAITAQLVSYPLDTLRRRMQMSGAQGVHYKGMMDCLRKVVATEGVAALYRGMAVSMLRTVPGAAIQFLAYDALKTGVAILDPTTAVSSPL